MQNLYHYINEAKGGSAKPGAVSSRCPKTVLGILTDPDLNPAQKLAMIGAYYEIS